MIMMDGRWSAELLIDEADRGPWAVGRVMCWFFSFLSCTCCTTTKKSTRPKGQSSRSRSRHLQEQLGIIPHRGGEEEPRRVVR